MVYFLAQKDNEMYNVNKKPLDGDYKKVTPIDMTPDDGLEIMQSCYNQGRPIDNTYLPTKIRWGGRKRDLPHVQSTLGALLVSRTFKDIVEKLEPGVHQFFPIELVWKDGSHADDRYWFNICTRLDSVDREKTTFEFRGLWYLDGDQTKKLVFSRSKIGNRHVWIDKFMSSPPFPRFVTETFKQEMDAAGVTGLNYHFYPETD